MMPPSPSRPSSKARIAAQRHGHRAETLAALFLRLKFYRILERRYKTPVGEIDLVAQRLGTIVFVEVKARGHSKGERDALEAVNSARIAHAAAHWQAHHKASAGRDFRFDVIFLAPGRWPRHVINAFDAS